MNRLNEKSSLCLTINVRGYLGNQYYFNFLQHQVKFDGYVYINGKTNPLSNFIKRKSKKKNFIKNSYFQLLKEFSASFTWIKGYKTIVNMYRMH